MRRKVFYIGATIGILVITVIASGVAFALAPPIISLILFIATPILAWSITGALDSCSKDVIQEEIKEELHDIEAAHHTEQPSHMMIFRRHESSKDLAGVHKAVDIEETFTDNSSLPPEHHNHGPERR